MWVGRVLPGLKGFGSGLVRFGNGLVRFGRIEFVFKRGDAWLDGFSAEVIGFSHLIGFLPCPLW